MNHWLLQRILGGRHTSPLNIKVGFKPNTQFNIRPIVTVKGTLVEWQYMLTNNGLDYQALANGPKPQPGHPEVTPTVIRFHPSDVKL